MLDLALLGQQLLQRVDQGVGVGTVGGEVPGRQVDDAAEAGARAGDGRGAVVREAAVAPQVEALAAEPQLQRYPWLAGAQADVLERLGRAGEAREAYQRAAELTDNEVQRALLTARAARLAN